MTEYLPKPDYAFINVGKDIKVSPSLVNEWQPDNFLNRFIGCLNFYSDCFVDRLDHFSVNNKLKAQIVTVPNQFCNTKSNLDWDTRVLLKEKVDELLSSGVLRASESSFSSPVYPKKFKELNVRKLFICPDYYELNQITMDVSYYVPAAGDITRSICKSSIFSIIVLKDAFHQIALEEESIPKTAFETKFGKFEFTVLHEGMKNARPYLQMLMNKVLEDVDRNYVKVYLDQILVHSMDFNNHLAAVNRVLSRLKSANLKIDLEETKFAMSSVRFGGFEISANGVSIPQEISKEIYFFKFPNSVEEVRSFMNLVITYRHYIAQFDQIAAPLFDILKAGRFVLNEQVRKAILSLEYAFWDQYKTPVHYPLRQRINDWST